MLLNEYGQRLDGNGYAPSVIQSDMNRCYICRCRGAKLDRHEIYQASNRDKSKRYGCWILICHDYCHLNGVHNDAALRDLLQKECQQKAMETYHWSADDFTNIFGKNYL